MTDLLYPFRTKSQQYSHEQNEQKRKNEQNQQRERAGDHREIRRDHRDLLGFDFAGKHHTIIGSGKKRR
ncbi:MAG: hypothetical protein WA130_07315 [Candidatus Methanoperedens sp.]